MTVAPARPPGPRAVSRGARGVGSSRTPALVALVEPDASAREVLGEFLRMQGHRVRSAAAWSALDDAKTDADIVLCPAELDDGASVIAIRAAVPRATVIVSCERGRAEIALACVRAGAFDFVARPFRVEAVVHTVARALERRRLERENEALNDSVSLHELAARLGQTGNLDETLSAVVRVARHQVDADGASVILWPTEGQSCSGAVDGRNPLTLHDLTATARRLAAPARLHGAMVDEFVARAPGRCDVGAVLALPLLNCGRTLGLLVAVRNRSEPFAEAHMRRLLIIADRAAAAVHNAQLMARIEGSFRATIEAFVTALEEKDRYTRGHSERVAEFCRVTAEALALPDAECELMYDAGRLHDIGKLAMRSKELNKPAALTEEEYARFRSHPGGGEALMAKIPMFQRLLPAIGMHHEKHDGTGYPRGLRGLQIPLMARITAVADTYDAMTSHRAYRSALEHWVAIDELRACAGIQFDPEVVEAFCVGIERWRAARAAAGRHYPR